MSIQTATTIVIMTTITANADPKSVQLYDAPAR